MERIDEAINILEEINLSPLSLHVKEFVQTMRAIAYFCKGEKDRAARLLKECEKLAKEVGDYDDQLRVLTNLVKAGEYGKIDEALKILERWRIGLRNLSTMRSVTSEDLIVLVDEALKRDVSKAREVHASVKNRSAIDAFGKGVEIIVDRGVLEEAERKVDEAIRSGSDVRSAVEEGVELTENEVKKVGEPFVKLEWDDEVIDFHFGEKCGYFYGGKFRFIEFKDLKGFTQELLDDELIRELLRRFYARKYGWTKGKIEVEGDWVYIYYMDKWGKRGRKWWARLSGMDLLRLLNDILFASLTYGLHEIPGLDFKFKRKSQEVTELILKYFGDAMRDLFSYDEVVIVPAYPLMNFPYHLIMDDNGRMLMEEVRVKYVPHSGVAKRLKEKQGRIELQKVVIVYSPEVRGDEEARVIEEVLVGRMEVVAINGDEIGKEELIERINELRPDILHFACHARADPFRAEYSYLKFKDKVVTLGDLVKLEKDLGIKLVCLSACETARYEEALDTLGLPLAFFVKGARSVVGTLHEIRSDDAIRFFEKFYEKLGNGCDVYDAYYESVLEMKKEKRDMASWGPFMYYGV